MRRAVPQSDHHREVGLRIRDDQREVLLLTVVPVEQRQLLLAVSRVVEAVEVKRQSPRLLVERVEELLDEQFPQSQQRLDADRILEPRQRRLRGQFGPVLGQPIADQLKHGIMPQRVVIVLILVEPFAVSHST